ncbi:MAG TPA: sodium-translocating pyrophosphatase [Clostridiaceae bacterium]|nr:sodium-translocating pyrophosphatase [Clostridiaceae bacterium]
MVISLALYIVLGGGLFALVFAFGKTRWIYRQEVNNPTLKKIGGYIAEGAMAFLSREYKVLTPFILLITAFLTIGNQGALRFQGVAFLLGAITSALAGFIGMRVATAANSRTAQAANDKGLNDALQIAFSGGSVMGMSVVGLALVGLFLVIFFGIRAYGADEVTLNTVILPLGTAFSLGASSTALFSRVGGGIFTKAADVGADLVGKVEAGIPEDDHRNPATIADNVGDNVGDVAGMGADLFESFVGSIVGAMILGLNLPAHSELKIKLMLLPLLVAAVGVVASIAGTLVVRTKPGSDPQKALNTGTFGAAGAATVLVFILMKVLIGNETYENIGVYHIFGATVIGLVAGVIIGQVTEYYTGTEKKPVLSILRSSETGPATTIITGIGVGMRSTFPTVLIIAAGILGSYLLVGLYGVGIAAVGMLVTLGIQLAVDAYGPIADNAGGLAEMAELPPSVRQITDSLDAVGNTTAAIGKGFAIGSAALTAIILFSSFNNQAGIGTVDITNTNVLVGILTGSVIPFLFSSLTMNAVGKAAYQMIAEVRRQFREMPGILAGTQEPDYRRCIDISTQSALKEMLPPGLVALISPVLVGFLGGAQMLLGLLIGVTITGVGLAIFMSNAGGAWDNAKKMAETEEGSRGTEAYKAAVVGDTVGDPFKDTAGPALNILIKLMSMVALVIAPMLQAYWR